MNAIAEHIITQSSQALAAELEWFAERLDVVFHQYFQAEGSESRLLPPPPELEEDGSPYAQIIQKFGFGESERLILCLAIAPHLRPNLLDLFFTRNSHFDRGFTEFGGYLGKDHSGFLPTGETAAFILGATQLESRFQTYQLLGDEHPFSQAGILHLERSDSQEPFLAGRLKISEEYLQRLIQGEWNIPTSNRSFPAKKIETKLDWDDFVAPASVWEEIEQLINWIKWKEQLMADEVFQKQVKPGFRSLFYGPPGTGKTMAASLIGKSATMPVYRIDLSLIVSKYIGETEKNLAKIFDYAERQNWILFFDEADALFGKRTQTKSSNDRYANQEVAYLLQRVEDFPGIIILASNLKSNMDEAFSRRFQSTVFFPMPDKQMRLLLWQKIFAGRFKPDENLDLQDLANQYELSGGSMINIFRYSTIKAMQRGSPTIQKEDLIAGIRKEFQKYGRTI